MRINRREFLRGAAGAAGLAMLEPPIMAVEMPGETIERIETFPVVYPTVGRFKFFEDHLGRQVGRQTVVVKITAASGEVGWGQSVPTPKWSYETAETVQTTIDRYLAPVLIGKDPFDTEGIHALMNQVIAPSFSTGQPICKAGIDLALFDLTGKLLKKTAAERWGRKGIKSITLSWTLNPKTLDDIPRLIDEGRARGYGNFNVKVAPDLAFDVAMCKWVKELAPDGFLWADANGGYDEKTALRAVPALADAGVAVLEQPVRPNKLSASGALRKIGRLPIVLDEGVVSSDDLEEFIRLDVLDGVAMKPARCGGLTDARRQVELLEKHGLLFLGSGLTDPDLSLAASLLLYGVYDLCRPAALNGPQFLQGSILTQPLEVKGGGLTVPVGPGLGVEVDEAKLRAWKSP